MGKAVKYPWQFYFVLAIPLINAVASNTSEYFTSDIFNTGNLRALIIGLFAIYFVIARLPNEGLSRFIIVYLAYYLVLVFFSTDRLLSGNLYLKYFLGIMMLPIGYYYINSIRKLKILLQILFLTLVLHLVNIAIANIFQLGTSDYLDETFYFGAGRVNITKNILILVFLMPATMLFVRKYRKAYMVVYLVAFLITIVGIKRSVLISAAAGVVAYLAVKQRFTLLLRTTAVAGLLFLIIILVFPGFTDLFRSRFEARGERVELTEETIETEGRLSEIGSVIRAWSTGSVKHKLIGSEVFNDRLFFDSKRMLHTDYMIILNGSGLIGFVLWFYLYTRLIREKDRYYRALSNHIFFRELNALFWVLLVAQLVLSVSGTVYAIELRSLIFLVWGAIIGVMRGFLFRRKADAVKMKTVAAKPGE
ncbi:MAG: hypothetical protein IH592_15825 [Bacteroidales bacterium]|nr:hypothetical protein [Bacteroidales bacterium]